MPVSDATKKIVMELAEKIVNGETSENITDIIALINAELP